ncbi:MAG: HlyD family secretion protein [Bacteroidales bacterium]
MKKGNLAGIAAGVAIILAIISLIAWFVIKPAPQLIQGEVVATTIKIASKVPGRIDSIFVEEGQSVKKGDVLFALSTPEVDAKLRQAQAVRNAAGAQDSKAKKGARKEEVQALYSVWQKAEAGYELALKTYQRAEKLHNSGVIPAQKFDEASANLKAMQATRTAAKSQYEMAKEGARNEDKKAAAAMYDQADAVVSEVTSLISDARQSAPIDAEVATIIAEPNELVGTGFPIITLVNLNDTYVTFNVKETLLPKLQKGTVVKGYIPGIDEKVDLTVERIAAQADYATWSATRTKGEFDIRTFEVKMRPSETQAQLRPGMSVIVNWDEIK